MERINIEPMSDEDRRAFWASNPNRPNEKNPCHGCGICCLHMRTPPFVPDTGEGTWTEWVALPKPLRDEVTAHAMRESPRSCALDLLGMTEDAPCLWFDMRTGRCREWALRPEVCREFEVGGETCMKMRTQVGLAAPAPAGEA